MSWSVLFTELTLSQLSTDGCWVDDFLMAAEQQNRYNCSGYGSAFTLLCTFWFDYW